MPKVNTKKKVAEKVETAFMASTFVKRSVRKIKTGYRAVGYLADGFRVTCEGGCKDSARSGLEATGLAIAAHTTHVKAAAAATRKAARTRTRALKAKG